MLPMLRVICHREICQLIYVSALHAHIVNKAADHVSNIDTGNTGSANKPSGLFIKSADRPLWGGG